MSKVRTIFTFPRNHGKASRAASENTSCGERTSWGGAARPRAWPTTSTEARAVPLVTRAACTVGLSAIWAAGYFTLGGRTLRGPAFDPSSALDAWIPFTGWAVWPYLLSIVGIALPAGLIRSPGLFLRTAAAYAIVIALSFVCFLLLPTDAATLRQYVTTSSLDLLSAWAIDTLHAIDPPTNLLPSLHVSLATLSTLALAKEYTAYRPLAYVGLAVLAASVCAVKQHFILDALSGIVLALAAFSVAGLLAVTPQRQDR